MKLPNHVTGQAFVPAAQYNELVDCVKFLMQNALVAAGPGLELRSLPQGKAVGVTTVGGEEGSTASPLVILHTHGSQDTDTWSRADDNCAVDVWILVDIYWANPYIKGVYRVLHFDSAGKLYEITAEEAAINMITAGSC